jgi:hypothetical protein
MYVNGKMRPVATTGGGVVKENDRKGEFNYDIFQELL